MDTYNFQMLTDRYDNGVRYKELFDEYIDKNTMWTFLKGLQPVFRTIQCTEQFFYNKIFRSSSEEYRKKINIVNNETDATIIVTATLGNDTLAYYVIDKNTGEVLEYKYYENTYCDLTPIKYNWRNGDKCVC